MTGPIHAAHSVDAPYAEAVGRATYAFALMEWNAIWCCEALDDGCVNARKHTTAGEVGEDFERLAHAVSDAQLKDP